MTYCCFIVKYSGTFKPLKRKMFSYIMIKTIIVSTSNAICHFKNFITGLVKVAFKKQIKPLMNVMHRNSLTKLMIYTHFCIQLIRPLILRCVVFDVPVIRFWWFIYHVVGKELNLLIQWMKIINWRIVVLC